MSRAKPAALEPLREWLDFFRDCGDLSAPAPLAPKARSAARSRPRSDEPRPVDSQPPRLVFVWDPPVGHEEERRREAEELLERMIAKLGLDTREVVLIAVERTAPEWSGDDEKVKEALSIRLARLPAPCSVVVFGASLTSLLTGSNEGILALRGRSFSFAGLRLVPTFHPLYLLKAPSRRKEAWMDLQSALERRESQ